MAADQSLPLSPAIRIRRGAKPISIPQIHAATVWNRRPFASVSASSRRSNLFAAIVGYCGAQRGGSLGRSELLLQDVNGDRHVFEFETFFNRHEALTLGLWSRSHGARVPVQTL